MKFSRIPFYIAKVPQFFAAGKYFYNNPYLVDVGWWQSFKSKTSIDKNGEAIPWITYPAIKFLASHLSNTLNVFEYGSGNSTIWYSKLVKQVAAVENNKEWLEVVKKMTRDQKNITVKYIDLNEQDNYEREIYNHPLKFQLVVIDGRRRVNCAHHAVNCITDDGVIILDNSERPEYQEAHDMLKSKGFRKLEFWGLGPINVYESCTSVFYKDNNCLGI